MNRKLLLAAVVPAFALIAGSVVAHDGEDRRSTRFRAELRPINEIPVVSSLATGQFKMTIDEANQTLTYEVSYDGLEGNVTQAHIHIGQRIANGGIMVFLCGNPPTVPPAAFPQPPACPPSPATVTGTLTPANIIGPAGQGIAPTTSPDMSDFAELVKAVRAGLTYANVHSSLAPGGEVRGQIEPRGRGH